MRVINKCKNWANISQWSRRHHRQCLATEAIAEFQSACNWTIHSWVIASQQGESAIAKICRDAERRYANEKAKKNSASENHWPVEHFALIIRNVDFITTGAYFLARPRVSIQNTAYVDFSWEIARNLSRFLQYHTSLLHIIRETQSVPFTLHLQIFFHVLYVAENINWLVFFYLFIYKSVTRNRHSLAMWILFSNLRFNDLFVHKNCDVRKLHFSTISNRFNISVPVLNFNWHSSRRIKTRENSHIINFI